MCALRNTIERFCNPKTQTYTHLWRISGVYFTFVMCTLCKEYIIVCAGIGLIWLMTQHWYMSYMSNAYSKCIIDIICTTTNVKIGPRCVKDAFTLTLRLSIAKTPYYQTHAHHIQVESHYISTKPIRLLYAVYNVVCYIY